MNKFCIKSTLIKSQKWLLYASAFFFWLFCCFASSLSKLLVIFFFFSIYIYICQSACKFDLLQLLGFPAARNFPTASNELAPEGYDHVDRFTTPNQDHEAVDSDELVAVDYTPTKKNPPIHN